MPTPSATYESREEKKAAREDVARQKKREAFIKKEKARDAKEAAAAAKAAKKGGRTRRGRRGTRSTRRR